MGIENINGLEVWDVQILYPGCCYMDGDHIIFLENDDPVLFHKLHKDWTVGKIVNPKHKIKLIGNLKPVIEIDIHSNGYKESTKIEFVK